MSEKTCATCRFWVRDVAPWPEEVYFPPLGDAAAADGDWAACDTDEASIVARGLHRVRRCAHPKIVFYQRPARDGAALLDGSQYRASFVTAEGYGCLLHEPTSEGA